MLDRIVGTATMVLNSLGTPLRKASFGSGRGGMMVVSIVFRKFTASSLIGMIVTSATSSSVQAGAPLLRAYARMLASNSAVVTARLPR